MLLKTTIRKENKWSDAIVKLPVLGVPLGSVLGPVLFLIYINDIKQSVNSNCTCNIFADDVVIYTTGGDIDTVNHELQSNIDSISDWYEYNRLSITPDKTKKICSRVLVVPKMVIN